MIFRLTATVLAVVVAVYNVHVFWTISLYHEDTSPICDATNDNYFMMHVFEYLKLISYCVVPFVIVLVLNVCIIVRLRQASPLQCADSVSLASSSNTTPSHPVINRSRRHFFAKTSMRSERPVSQSVVDETRDRLVTPSRREVMYVVCIYSEAHPDRGLD